MAQNISNLTPTRVALVTGCLKLGGSTTFLCNLAGELVRRQISVEVLSLEKENPLASDFQRLNVPVMCLDEGRLIFEDRMRAVLRRLNQFRPTVVVGSLSPLSYEVLRYAPPRVLRIAMAQSDEPNVYEVLRLYAEVMNVMAAVSRTIQQKFEAMPEFAQVPVQYLPYGVPMPEETETVQRDQGRPLRILYIGRLEREQKRVQLFPEILKGLKSSGIPFHWSIAGEGSAKAFLEKAMKSESPRQTVSFMGKVLYEKVPDVLQTHDVFLLASDYEGLPLSLLEAMGRGMVPVISDLQSGVGEVVDGTTGKLVAPDHVAGYAEAIVWLHLHRDEMRRLSKNACVKVSREFSLGAMTDRWLGVFPKTTATDMAWPERARIKPPLTMPDNWRFSLPVRILRRMLLKFQR